MDATRVQQGHRPTALMLQGFRSAHGRLACTYLLLSPVLARLCMPHEPQMRWKCQRMRIVTD